MKARLIAIIICLLFMIPAWAGALVDLNSATQAQLESVKGIGPAKARAIIDYRSKMGPFKSVDDLKKVTGFGAKTVAKMRSALTVDNIRPPATRAEISKSR